MFHKLLKKLPQRVGKSRVRSFVAVGKANLEQPQEKPRSTIAYRYAIRVFYTSRAGKLCYVETRARHWSTAGAIYQHTAGERVELWQDGEVRHAKGDDNRIRHYEKPKQYENAKLVVFPSQRARDGK